MNNNTSAALDLSVASAEIERWKQTRVKNSEYHETRRRRAREMDEVTCEQHKSKISNRCLRCAVELAWIKRELRSWK